MSKRTSWHEDDRFWSTFEPKMFSEKCLNSAHEQTDQLLALLELKEGAKMLDLCCGPGRHSLELARRGFRVTGVDRTARYLRTARKTAKPEGLKIEFVRADMRRFCRRNAFDAAINMFTAFGYFDDPAEDRQVIGNLYRSLKKGGKLLMDVQGKEILARNFQERTWQAGDDGELFIEEHKVTRDWTWLENRWILVKGNTRREFKLCLRVYSAAELKALLQDCGFSTVQIYGSLAGIPYDHKAKRLVALAQK
ncbi:MAG: class I SAM-dependent methyltransferase [Kiritimatiellae bacterium]|nr:class I SAM-dependent methyltransferase [Kiritimatiellia bacterium]